MSDRASQGSQAAADPAQAAAAAAFRARYPNAPLGWSPASRCRFDHSDVDDVRAVRCVAEEDIACELQDCCAQLGVSADWALQRLDATAAAALSARWQRQVQEKLAAMPEAQRAAFPGARAHLLQYVERAALQEAEAARRISDRVELLEMQAPTPVVIGVGWASFDDEALPKTQPQPQVGLSRRAALAAVMAQPAAVSDEEDF